MSSVLAVIPARGGSKEIIGKNLRPLHGKPLLLWTYETLDGLVEVDRIVVSTEDEAIASFCRLRDIEVVDRPAHLATDQAVVTDVAQHTARELGWEGEVLLVQPTCPLLSHDTIRSFMEESRHTATCYDDHWGDKPIWTVAGYKTYASICPVQRKNRQYRQPNHIETGMYWWPRVCDCFATDPEFIDIDASEALDIDTLYDWEIAERVLGRKKILFSVLMDRQHGTGHFWRALQLTEALAHHKVQWVGSPRIFPKWAQDLLEDRKIPFVGANKNAWCDLLVLDRLDYMAPDMVKPRRVAVFESIGDNTKGADLVVNELLPDWGPNVMSGPDFAVLRPEFLHLPMFLVKEEIKTIVLSFGGSDPSRLSGIVAMAVRRVHPDAQIRIIVGPNAYHPTGLGENIEVVTNARMAEELCGADVAVTSRGRTMWEAAACGVPTVTVMANERESTHIKCDGMIHADRIDDIHDHGSLLFALPYEERVEMSQISSQVIDGKGVDRIVTRFEELMI